MLPRLLLLLFASRCLLPAQDPPLPDTDASGIPYALIEAAPSLGKVKAYNPNYGFGVVELSPGVKLKRGDVVAARREGVVISRGFIESVEGSGTAVVQFSPFTPDPDSLSRVRVGDGLIPFPPPPLATPAPSTDDRP